MGEDWLARWRDGRTGWHEAGGNQGLMRHWRARDRRVLVPLCGATPDLVWLAGKGNDITGVELSPIAAEAFFDTHGIACRRESGDWPTFSAVDLPIRIVVCDFFDFRQRGFDAVYDRASLIALPEAVRPRYVEHLASLLDERAYQLLITLEYDQALAAGPPFAVLADEVTQYYPQLSEIERRSDLGNGPPKFRDLPSLDEVVWRFEGAT